MKEDEGIFFIEDELNMLNACKLASQIRDMGFAVVFFSKDEMVGIPIEDMETYLKESGNMFIQENEYEAN